MRKGIRFKKDRTDQVGYRKTRRSRALLVLMVFTLAFSTLVVPASAESGDRTWDGESNHTAFITEKSAQWTDYENYLADLTLSVNGTQVREPLDVVIVLDRSGSMDMEYKQGGAHYASCPCLNPDHFTLKPVEGAVATAGDDESKIYYGVDGTDTVTVYNAEKKVWVVLSTVKEHLYYQYTAEGSNPTHDFAAYHFNENDDGTLNRISVWDTTDVRKKTNEGVWDHADAAQGCYDRWTEAKNAIEQFATELLAANPNNRVSLVPFSIHDDAIAGFLNPSKYNRTEERDWLIEQGYFGEQENDPVNGLGYDSTGTLVGDYNSKVSWTNDVSDITNVLPTLFTTSNTDYVYALSEAYEMLADRGETDNKAVIVFLSDGVPYPIKGSDYPISFCNQTQFVTPLLEAITSSDSMVTSGGNWGKGKDVTSSYPRHSVRKELIENVDGTYGVKGQGAQIVTVSYMIDENATDDILEEMASNPESYIEIPAGVESSSAGHLATKLLNSSIFPGGQHSVLRDEVSEYFYVNPDQTLPDGVTIDTDPESGNDVIVWDIGDIYAYEKDEEPTITVELILKEAYRADMISQTTYYPTNADTTDKGRDIYDPENGPDDDDTGAKLNYTDPDDDLRYDTIGTPKLPVIPTNPGDPTPATVVIPSVRKTVTGDIPSHSSAFTFTLTAVTKDAPMPSSSTGNEKAISISGSGTSNFGSLVFTEAGSYTYTIKEANSGFAGYTYDAATYTLTIVVEEKDGALVATSTMTKSGATGTFDQAAFTNRYTETNGDLTIYLSKRLTDEAGNLTGTGKPFGVHLYDENQSLISSIVLIANNGEVAVSGLQSGKTYYIIEEDWEYYTIEGYTVFETELMGHKAIGLQVAPLEAGTTGFIRIQVNNSTPDITQIPDELVPLAPGVLNDLELIEIEPEKTPLGATPATGDANTAGLGLVLTLSALAGAGVFVYARKRKA